jgi:hypothetical protein
MTKSNIRHRLINVKVRMDTTSLTLKAVTVPVYMLRM